MVRVKKVPMGPTVVVEEKNITKSSNKKKKSRGKKKNNTMSSSTLTSPYLRSLYDPFRVTGARIPDDVTTPSFAVALDQKYTVPGNLNASGTLGQFAAVALQVGACNSGQDFAYANTDTTGSITWNYANLASTSAITASSSQIRPVSAGLALTYQGSTNNDQGRFVVGFYPSGVLGATATTIGLPTSPAVMISNAPYLVTLPAAKRYASVRYCPLDSISRSYSTPGTGSGGNPLRALFNSLAACQYGVLVIMVDGVTSLPSIEARLKVNYECIPKNNQTSFQSTEPSWTNPVELAMVANTIACDKMFNVDQSWANELAGVATSYQIAGQSSGFAHPKHMNGNIPMMGSSAGDIGGLVGRAGGEILGAVLAGI